MMLNEAEEMQKEQIADAPDPSTTDDLKTRTTRGNAKNCRCPGAPHPSTTDDLKTRRS